MGRRDHALEDALIDFDHSVLRHVRDEACFARALEDAETAESLADAMASHDVDIEVWAAVGMILLRAVQSADQAYERELGDALDHFRNSVVADSDGNGDPPG